MSIITPELSKQVGWEKRTTPAYPNLDQVNKASDYQLLVWYRFLQSPSSDNENEMKVMTRICERVREQRD